MIISLPEQTRITLLPNGRSLDAREMLVEETAFSRRLTALGVGRGDCLVLIASYDPTFFSLLFSAWRVGACVACVNSSITASELQNVCGFVQAKAVASVAPSAATAGLDVPVEVFQENPATGDSEEGEVDGLSSDSCLDDDALILFTSGTTGDPKGVTHTFRSLLARIALNRAEIGTSTFANTLCPLPTHFGHGLIGNCLTALISGAHLHLLPGLNAINVSEFGEMLDDNEISFMSSVPAMWRIVVRLSPKPRQGYLRRVHVGSAPLSTDLWGDIAEWCSTNEVWNMYGITETCNWIGGRSYLQGNVKNGDVGKVWGGSFAVLTEAGEIKPQGRGEVLVQSPSLMRGYFKNPELTDTVLKNGWFYTGDFGELDRSGLVRLIGRQKSEINRAGLKISPEEIDLLLEKHAAVTEACAFAIPDPVAGQIVGVAVCPADPKTFDLSAVKDYCLNNLIPEKNPEKWFVLDEIPKTDRGKLNRDIVASTCIGKIDA